MTKKKKAVEPAKPVQLSVKEKLLQVIADLCKTHSDEVIEQLQDYIVDEELQTYVAGRNHTLKEDFENEVHELLPVNDFGAITDLLKGLKTKDIDTAELLAFCDPEDVTDDFLEKCDKEQLCKIVGGTAWAVIKITNNADRAKLEDFVKAEIYPYLTDQQTNMFI